MALLRSYMQLVRLPTVAAAAGTVLAGGYIATSAITTDSLVLALGMSFVVALAQVFNDVIDYDADSHRSAPRPLHRGGISLRAAKSLCGLLAIAGFVTLLGLRDMALLLEAQLMSAVSLAYSLYLKSTVIVGNLVTAALSGLLVPLGAQSYGRAESAVWLAGCLVASSMFLYETLKTVRDGDADRAAGLRTVGTAWSRRGQAALIAATSVAVLAVVAILTSLVNSRPGVVVYCAGMGLGLVVPIVGVGRWIVGGMADEGRLRWAIGTMRYGRYFGIAALLVLA